MPEINYSLFFSQDAEGSEGFYMGVDAAGAVEILTYFPGPAAEWRFERVDTSTHYWVVHAGTGKVLGVDQSVTPWKVVLEDKLPNGMSHGILGQIWYLRASNGYIEIINWVLQQALAIGLQVPGGGVVGLFDQANLVQNIGVTTLLRATQVPGAFPDPAITSATFYGVYPGGFVQYTVSGNNFGQQPGPFRCTIEGNKPQVDGQALFLGGSELPTDGDIVFVGVISYDQIAPGSTAIFTIEDPNQMVVSMFQRYLG